MFYKNRFFDYPKNPTMRNTPKHLYNCGGYAFQQPYWYLPFRSRIEQIKMTDAITIGTVDEYGEAYDTMVSNILRDFPEWRIISNEDVRRHNIDYKKYVVIAFRCTTDRNDGDFHFMRLTAGGRWMDKRGASAEINCHAYNSIFDVWYGRYKSKTTFFIKERA